MTGSGDMVVRADELAEYFGLKLDDVNETASKPLTGWRLREVA
jgi:hypothetical protein